MSVTLLRLVVWLDDLSGGLLRRPLLLNSAMVSRILDSACYNGRRAMKELEWHSCHDLLRSLPEMVAA